MTAPGLDPWFGIFIYPKFIKIGLCLLIVLRLRNQLVVALAYMLTSSSDFHDRICLRTQSLHKMATGSHLSALPLIRNYYWRRS